MTVQTRTTKWIDDHKPRINAIVELWHHTYGVILGVWTGKRWETPEGMELKEITHWRPR